MDFIDSLMVKIALIGLLGIGAQWVAWRTGKPAIALMMLAGLVAGPVTGVIVPERDFGALLEPIIKLAVAVILFDGGLSLNFRELRASKAGGAVLGLVVVGVPVGWALGTAAAYYGADLPFGVAALFGGIMVVTGPTVIGPLLRNLNIGRRPAQILRWEGIVNDPIGALLAVFIFAWITYRGAGRDVAGIAAEVALATGIAALIGVAAAMLLTWTFRRGLVPEYLKAPVLLVSVIASFVAADLNYHETGLVTVTVMGIIVGNSRLYEFESLRRFKEDLGVLLVSGVFILLPATLDWSTMRAFELRFLLFLLLLLFVVRPVTVMASLLFSGVPWRERAFIAWIAPRGVVAVAISGLFALRLEEHDIAGAEALIPLSFGVVVATIVAHGFTASLFARRLGIDQGEGKGLLLVGANPWTIALGRFVADLGFDVTVADDSRLALRGARREGLAVYRGDILGEVTEDVFDLSRFQQLVAATGSPARNALICADLGPEMGYHAVAQVAVDDERPPLHHRGRVLLEKEATLETLVARHEAGWRFRRTELTERFALADKKATMTEGTLLVAALKPDGRLLFFGSGARPAAETGDVLISYAPPDR